MPKLIVELPSEILAQIFTHFAGDKRMLTSLAPLCRVFSEQIQPILLHRVKISINPRGGSGLAKLNQLIRTLRENSCLACLVRDLDIYWPKGNGKIYKSVNLLLEQVKQLRTLKLAEKDFTGMAPFPKLSDLQSNTLANLTDLVIDQKRITPEHLVDYMFQGNVERLSIPTITFSIGSPTLPHGFKPGVSTLSDFAFGDDVHVPLLVLQELLRWPRALKKLRSTLPITRERLVGGPGWKEQLSPAKIGEALWPFKMSLVELELIHTKFSCPIHDRSQLDLSGFVSLAKINISSACFFAPMTPGREREGLYKLLPHSVIDLTIIYHSKDTINPPQEDTDGTWSVSHLTRTDCYWLEEFAIYKTTHSPNLKSVSILERIGKLSSRIYPEKWMIPITVEGALKEAGITFRGIVRATPGSA